MLKPRALALSQRIHDFTARVDTSTEKDSGEYKTKLSHLTLISITQKIAQSSYDQIILLLDGAVVVEVHENL